MEIGAGSNFWPLVGITALILVLLAVADSAGEAFEARSAQGEISMGASILLLLIYGPLMGVIMFVLSQDHPGRAEDD